MNTYRSVKDIAATVRAALKSELPGWKFSVVVNHHTSITVALMEGPEQVVEAHNEYMGREGSNYVPYTEKHPFPGYAQLNHYMLLAQDCQETRLTNGEYLTETGWAVMKRATELLSIEHWDKSDSMTDYFCCAFYRSVHIGKWNQNYVVKGTK